MADKTSEAFAKLDTIKYAGKCVGMVDGKITIIDTDPDKVYEKLKNISNKEIGIFCFPSSAQIMAF